MVLTLQAWRVESDRLIASLGDHDLHACFPAPGIARVSLFPKGQEPASTPAIVEPGAALRLVAREEADSLVISGGGVALRVAREGLALALVDESGTMIQERIVPVLDEGIWRIAVPLPTGTRCYGLGEKTGYLDKRGRRYTMWNTDDPTPHIETLDPMYVSVPWAILFEHGRALGLYLDDPTRTVWDVGNGEPEQLVVTTPRNGLDLYLVAGPTLAEVVERYGSLTGRMPLPPLWAIGYQQSRWSYESADRMREVVREYRQREIPLDVLYADIDYMDGYRVFTWNPTTFPEPKALMAELAGHGVKVVPIVDPGIKKDGDYPVFVDGLARDVFVRDRDGMPLVGVVWPGEVCFPDFARPDVRRWWGDLHHHYLDVGVAGIWNDMNEPALFDTPTRTMPLDARHGEDGMLSHELVHNLYGWSMSQATREGLLRLKPDHRPFVLTRSGFAGVQRHAAVWTGDNFSIWFHLEQALPMVMNMGLSGLSFVGPDVGGFSGDSGGELMARWTQVGAFTPFFRNHAAKGTSHQEPWVFGPEVEEICRRYIRMRYEWLPYFYTAFWRSSVQGTPIMRPLVYDYPEDPEVPSLHDQALVGPDVILAPLMRPGARHRLVYLPDGEWFDLWTDARIPGKTWHHVEAGLECVPLFIRAGSVIPRGPWAPSVDQLDRERLELHVYPGARLSGEWYDDDGRTLAYQQGGYNHWRFEGTSDAAHVTLSLLQDHAGYASATRRVLVIVHGASGAAEVTFEGEAVPWRQEGGRLVVERPMEPGTWRISGLAWLAPDRTER